MNEGLLCINHSKNQNSENTNSSSLMRLGYEGINWSVCNLFHANICTQFNRINPIRPRLFALGSDKKIYIYMPTVHGAMEVIKPLNCSAQKPYHLPLRPTNWNPSLLKFKTHFLITYKWMCKARHWYWKVNHHWNHKPS